MSTHATRLIIGAALSLSGCTGSSDAPLPDAYIVLDQVVDRLFDDAPDITPADQAAGDLPPGCHHPPVIKDCSDGWCKIPAGCFTMGSPANEPCKNAGKSLGPETQHEVTLSHDFEIQQVEVTQKDFSSGPASCPDCPAVYVGWSEVLAYCNALSAKKGLTACYECTGNDCNVAPAYAFRKIYTCPGYRLPTEAEWEYAYRAGTKTGLYSGELSNCLGADPNADKIAWHYGNAGGTVHPVGQKQPNAWGLYDMSGNALELCNDGGQYDLGPNPVTDPAGSGPVGGPGMRGGSFGTYAADLRAAARDGSGGIGFRCARTLNP